MWKSCIFSRTVHFRVNRQKYQQPKGEDELGGAILMRIVVNHFTRMQKGFMCVAGIDLATRQPIRPVLDRQMRVEMLACHGGPFELGRIVNLGQTRFVGHIPEVEDQQFDPAQVHVEGELDSVQFRQLLESVATESLEAIFGRELQAIGSTCAVAEHCGLRSLGCLWASKCSLYAETTPSGTRRIRLAFSSDRGLLKLPVTDVRLYGEDHVTVDEQQIANFAARLHQSDRILLSLGLSRPYHRSADEPPRHWLQVNNIHL